MKREFLEKRD